MCSLIHMVVTCAELFFWLQIYNIKRAARPQGWFFVDFHLLRLMETLSLFLPNPLPHCPHPTFSSFLAASLQQASLCLLLHFLLFRLWLCFHRIVFLFCCSFLDRSCFSSPSPFFFFCCYLFLCALILFKSWPFLFQITACLLYTAF